MKFLIQKKLIFEGEELLKKSLLKVDEYKRIQSAILMLQGEKISKISKLTKLSKGTIASLYRKVNKLGFSSLLNKKKSGRKHILSDEQYLQLKEDISKDPLEFNYNVCGGITLLQHIKEKFSIDVSLRTSQYIFPRLGYSFITPQTFPSKGMNNLNEQIKCILFINSCINNNYVIAFQDEVHFKLQTSTTRAWYPKGSRPQVKSFPGQQSVCYSGIVVPGTGYLHIFKPERFTYASCIEELRDFIKVYPRQEGQKIILFMDNAPWHKKAIRLIQEERLPEYQDIRDALQLVTIPPYCPHLNPIEQVWRITRREVTHNRFFATLEDKREALDGYFARFAMPNEKFQKLCSFRWFDMAVKRISESFGSLLKAA